MFAIPVTRDCNCARIPEDRMKRRIPDTAQSALEAEGNCNWPWCRYAPFVPLLIQPFVLIIKGKIPASVQALPRCAHELRFRKFSARYICARRNTDHRERHANTKP